VIIVTGVAASATIGGGDLYLTTSAGVAIGSAVLADSGSGWLFTSQALAPGRTEFTIEPAPATAVMAQAIATFGVRPGFAGGSSAHGAGLTSAVAEMLKPRYG